MKALLAALLLCACTDAAERAGKASAVEQVTSAPARAKVKTDLLSLRGAILTYQRLHEGQNPPALSDLEQIERLFYPDDYEYDAESGTVKSRTYPEM
jgi:hypothetical protein